MGLYVCAWVCGLVWFGFVYCLFCVGVRAVGVCGVVLLVVGWFFNSVGHCVTFCISLWLLFTVWLWLLVVSFCL